MNFSDFFPNDPDERPLDRIPDDGGFCAIFRTIGVVGDSMSAGELEGTGEAGETTYHDFFSNSWGQYLARLTHSTARIFARGGMTAREYWESYADSQNFWSTDLACQAYLLALGVNDLNDPATVLGTVSDALSDSRPATFAGWYGAIVRRLMAIQPDAKFFFLTIPREENEPDERRLPRDAHARLLHGLADALPNAYVIDLRRDAPVYDADMKKHFFMGNHMNPCGYLLAAKMTAAYIDYLIRHDMEAFMQIPFIGTPYRFRA
jgi:hypothetical protein